MSIDLSMVVLMALTAPALAISSATAVSLSSGGLSWGFGNRHTEPRIPDWVVRFKRSHRNFVENFPSFVAVVLVARMLSVDDQVTAMAAVVFAVSRVLFVGLYVAGITFMAVRTLSYFISVGAITAIAMRILI